MLEMLRHGDPVLVALSIIIRKRIVAMKTRGTKCYILILLQYLLILLTDITFLMVTGLVS